MIFFAEWPRKGIEEVNYIYNIYRGIADEAGGRIAPVCYSFHHAMKEILGLSLWDQDGNHSDIQGAYLSACVISKAIGGRGTPLSAVPNGINAETARKLAEVSEKAYIDLATIENSAGSLIRSAQRH